MFDVPAQSLSQLLHTMLAWSLSEQDTILWIKIMIVPRGAMCLDRATVVILKLWPKPFRFITIPSIQCTSPNRAVGCHTKPPSPQSPKTWLKQSPVLVRDSALGFLPAHFGLFCTESLHSLIRIEESCGIVCFKCLFKYIKKLSSDALDWIFTSNLQDIWRFCSKWLSFTCCSFESQHFSILGFNKSWHTLS